MAQRQAGGLQPTAPGQSGAVPPKAGKSNRSRTLLVIGLALGLMLLPFALRAFVIEAFKIPSGAMFPTIEIGDHLFATKSSYGFFDKSAPGRGDLVVFTYPDLDPNKPRVDFIKRVIALPKDRLEVESGAPIINGWKVPRCRLGQVAVSLHDEPATEMEVFVEFLEGQAYVVVLDLEHDQGRQGPYVVAPDEFWVLGDNRNNSSDSRVWYGGRGGGVPFANLRGRAWLLWMPPERFGITLHGPPVLPSALKQLEGELDRCLAAAPSLAASTPPASR